MRNAVSRKFVLGILIVALASVNISAFGDVVIGGDMVLLRDGERWFGMMMYANSCREVSGRWEPDVEALDYVLDHLEGTPFGLLDYSTPIGGYDYTKEMGDKCAARGIAWGLSLKDNYEPRSGWPRWNQREGYFPGQAPLDVARELARRLKGHPALAFYYTNDELPTGDWHSKLRAMQVMLEREDPSHPTLHQHNGDRVEEQQDCYDIYAHQFFNGGVRQVSKNFGRMPGIAAKAAGVGAPFWGCTDLHLSTTTDEKFRTMCYGLIANGARGILFYAFHRMHERYAGNESGFERHWGELVEVAREVEGRVDILLGPLADEQCSTDAGDVAIRTVTGENGRWVLVVNGQEKGSRNISVDVGPSVIEAVDDSGRTYPVRGDSLQLRLDAYDVYLIELRSKLAVGSADFNEDGIVNFLDFSYFVENWLGNEGL